MVLVRGASAVINWFSVLQPRRPKRCFSSLPTHGCSILHRLSAPKWTGHQPVADNGAIALAYMPGDGIPVPDFQNTRFLVLDPENLTVKLSYGYPSMSPLAAWMLEGPTSTQDNTVVLCNVFNSTGQLHAMNHEVRGEPRVPGDAKGPRWALVS